MDCICCVISLKGFNAGPKPKKFLTMELAWINMETGKRGIIKLDFHSYDLLTDADTFIISCTSRSLHRINGPIRVEFVPMRCWDAKILAIYNECKTEKKDLVAYRGGIAAKELLEKLKIPNVNLMKFGIPKYSELKKYDPTSVCKLHKNSPCSSSEVIVYKSWILDNKDISDGFVVDDSDKFEDSEFLHSDRDESSVGSDESSVGSGASSVESGASSVESGASSVESGVSSLESGESSIESDESSD